MTMQSKQQERRIVVANAFSVNMLTQDTELVFSKKTTEEVRQLLASADEVVSAVGHSATAELFSRLLAVPIHANRVEVKLAPSVVLVVGALGARLPEGAVLSEEELAAFPISWWVISERRAI